MVIFVIFPLKTKFNIKLSRLVFGCFKSFLEDDIIGDIVLDMNQLCNIRFVHVVGQAYVIFKTREATEMVVSKLDEQCLLLSNGRYGCNLNHSIVIVSNSTWQSFFVSQLCLGKFYNIKLVVFVELPFFSFSMFCWKSPFKFV